MDETWFPLIRNVSCRVTPLLVRLNMSPNQVTALGLVFGVLAAIAFSFGERSWGLVGAGLWCLCYLMDHCDGELARLTGKNTRLGKYFDDTADVIVHTCFFLGLGEGMSTATGETHWWWFGCAAALGCVLNQVTGWLRANEADGSDAGDAREGWPENTFERLVYIFRALTRADFWLLVLVLEVAGVTWVLLPLGAIGAQIYWMAGFLKGADRFA